jgi:hypothetical protein
MKIVLAQKIPWGRYLNALVNTNLKTYFRAFFRGKNASDLSNE